VPGLPSASPDLEVQFALAAFDLPAGRISPPVCGEKDETECLLVLLSGTRWPSEEDFKRRGFGPFSDWEVFRAAGAEWQQVISRLGEPKR
jgi:hypothetical protein